MGEVFVDEELEENLGDGKVSWKWGNNPWDWGSHHINESSGPVVKAFKDIVIACENGKNLNSYLKVFLSSLADDDMGRDNPPPLLLHGALDFLLAVAARSDFIRDKDQSSRFDVEECSLVLLILHNLLVSSEDVPVAVQIHPFLAFDVCLAAAKLNCYLAGCGRGSCSCMDQVEQALKASRELLLHISKASERARAAIRRGLCWQLRCALFEYVNGARCSAEKDCFAQLRNQLSVSADTADSEWQNLLDDYDCAATQVGCCSAEDLKLGHFIAETRRLTRAGMAGFLTSPASIWPSVSEMHQFGKKEQDRRYHRCAELSRKAKIASKSDARSYNHELTALVLNVGEKFITNMIDSKVFSESRRFSTDCRAYDKAIGESEEFQAGRNVWACLGLQLILANAKVECHSAVLGYSLLYPYTDNYLDDKDVGRDEKMEFQLTFRRWLLGEHHLGSSVRLPKTPLEQKIMDQISFIEDKWPRADHLAVYYALVAILDGQTRSLYQIHPKKPLSFVEVADISCDKGGSSVLADLYIVFGAQKMPERWQAAYSFALGITLQFVDDIQDIIEDRKEGNHTIFSVSSVAPSKTNPGDKLARQLCNFTSSILVSSAYGFDYDAETDETGGVTVRELMEGKKKMVHSIVFKAIARSSASFSKQFIDEAETRMPLPLRAMKRLAGMANLLKEVKADRI